MGELVAECDANGHWTRKQVTIRGKPYQIQYADGSSEEKEYSLDGLLVKEVAANGLVTRYSHDALGRVVRTEKSDIKGIILSTTEAVYNTFHLLSETDEEGNVTRYSYDGAGRQSAIHKGDQTTFYHYDSLGRLHKEIRGESVLIKEYDLLGRVVQERIEDLLGHRYAKKRFSYDCHGNRTELITYSQEGRATHTTHYNPHNEPTAIIDALGHRTNFSCERVHHRGQLVRQVTRTDPLGNQEVKLHDAQGRLVLHSCKDRQGQTLQSEQHDYDAAGHRLRTTADVFALSALVRRTVTEWEYDAKGNMIRCFEAKGTPEEKETRLSYNAEGQKERVIKPDGTKLYYQYDLLGRLISTKAPQWRETIPADGFDASGNLLQRKVVDQQGDLNYCYGYDDLYQLISEVGLRTDCYQNDSLYNRLSKNQAPYKLNDLNQLLSEGETSYRYDRNGNLIEMQEGSKRTRYFYDALDRLIRIEQGSKVSSYQYDAFHRRMSKTSEGITERYLYQQENEIGVQVGSNITELRLLGIGHGAEIGAAVALELEGAPFVPLHDSCGNVVTLLDLSGHVAASYRYTALGEEQCVGSPKNPWRYASKRADPESGLIYFGRRYYMPEVGRWLTPDPLWFEDGPNLYAYLHNHPLAYVDPDGQFAMFLLPLAISLAAEYCLPTVAAYASQYAGGALAASFLVGMVSGYADPISSACDPSTYTLGNIDLSSMVCNRAGMLIGAAIACSPSKQGATLITNVGSVAMNKLAGATVAKAEQTIIREVAKSGSKVAVQRVSQVGEGCLFKGITHKSEEQVMTLAGKLNFTKKPIGYMAQPARHVPRHILADTILKGKQGVDPKGCSGLMQYTQEMFCNGKKYNMEVLYREVDDTIVHFKYKPLK